MPSRSIKKTVCELKSALAEVSEAIQEDAPPLDPLLDRRVGVDNGAGRVRDREWQSQNLGRRLGARNARRTRAAGSRGGNPTLLHDNLLARRGEDGRKPIAYHWDARLVREEVGVILQAIHGPMVSQLFVAISDRNWG